MSNKHILNMYNLTPSTCTAELIRNG